MVKDESDIEAEGEYTVEKILRKRIRNGKVEYFLKWQGFGDDDCTWEPRDHLTCEDLIEEFEQNLEKKPNIKSKRASCEPSILPSSKDDVLDPFIRDPKKDSGEILEVGQRNGVLCFRIKWTDDSGSDWVSAEVANNRCPHIVLRYYQDLLKEKQSVVH